MNNTIFGKNIFQLCESGISELAEPFLQTASQNPRGLLAISGGIAVLSGTQILRASHVSSIVRSWFWQNENEEIPPPRWGMTIVGTCSICLGACAVAMAIFGFSDLAPIQSEEPRMSENYSASLDSEEEAQRNISSNSSAYVSDSNRCEPMVLKNPLAREFSYLFHSGYHALQVSPIIESRAHEYKTICDAARHPIHGRILRELGQNLYRKDQTYEFPFTMIDPKQCDEAAPLADQLYSRFLDSYRCHGVDETNAVQYEFMPSSRTCLSSVVREFLECGNTESGRKCELLSIAKVCKGQLRPPHKPDYCLPDSLIAIHELMHLQELPAMIHKDSNSDLFQDLSEIMTVTKSIINADEIAKKLDGIDLAVEKEYGQKSYLIDECKIPLGKFANFYRELEKQERSLANALVSEKSIRFLTCADA